MILILHENMGNPWWVPILLKFKPTSLDKIDARLSAQTQNPGVKIVIPLTHAQLYISYSDANHTSVPLAFHLRLHFPHWGSGIPELKGTIPCCPIHYGGRIHCCHP